MIFSGPPPLSSTVGSNLSCRSDTSYDSEPSSVMPGQSGGGARGHGVGVEGSDSRGKFFFVIQMFW